MREICSKLIVEYNLQFILKLFLDDQENRTENQLFISSSRMPRDKESLLMFYLIWQTNLFEITLPLKLNNIYDFISFVKEIYLKNMHWSTREILLREKEVKNLKRKKNASQKLLNY